MENWEFHFWAVIQRELPSNARGICLIQKQKFPIVINFPDRGIELTFTQNLTYISLPIRQGIQPVCRRSGSNSAFKMKERRRWPGLVLSSCSIVSNKSLFDTIDVSQGSPVTWTKLEWLVFFFEPQLLKIRMLITDEGSASDRWASLAWIPGRFWMIYARDSCIQSCGVLGLEGEGEKRKYIEDVHRTRLLLVRFRWLSCVVAEKSFERRIEKKSLNIRVWISQGNYDSPVFARYSNSRLSQGFVSQGRNLRRFIKIALGREIFQPVSFFFFKIKLPVFDCKNIKAIKNWTNSKKILLYSSPKWK